MAKIISFTSGANVRLLKAYDFGVFWDLREVNGILVVPPIWLNNLLEVSMLTLLLIVMFSKRLAIAYMELFLAHS